MHFMETYSSIVVSFRSIMRVHADILKMAGSQEKRELILWFHARHIFFGNDVMALHDGTALVSGCSHYDARFLMSLFPEGVPQTTEDAVATFLEHGKDARCLCWASRWAGEAEVDLLRQAAEQSDAWGQAIYASKLIEKERVPEAVRWLEKSVAQGEREGMSILSSLLFDGFDGVEGNWDRSKSLAFEGAMLGDPSCQLFVADRYCVEDPVQEYAWLRRSMMQENWHSFALSMLGTAATRELRRWEMQSERNIQSADAICELGSAFAKKRSVIYCLQGASATKVLVMYDGFCDKARRSVFCWLWLSKQIGLVKDIRVLIADLVWEQRGAWALTRS